MLWQDLKEGERYAVAMSRSSYLRNPSAAEIVRVVNKAPWGASQASNTPRWLSVEKCTASGSPYGVFVNFPSRRFMATFAEHQKTVEMARGHEQDADREAASPQERKRSEHLLKALCKETGGKGFLMGRNIVLSLTPLQARDLLEDLTLAGLAGEER